MRINELLEGRFFDHSQFTTPKNDGGREINFDLAEDLVYYMNENDNVYRRHVYPVVHKCVSMLDAKKSADPQMFADVVKECYKAYAREFPIRELPDDLSEELCKEICDKVYEQICQDHEDGLHKD